MDAPAVVLGLVLAETAIGGLALVWLAPTWGKVRHGYEILQAALLALMAWGAAASFATPLRILVEREPAIAGSAGLIAPLLVATAIAAGVAVIALVVKLPPMLARVAGVGSVALGLASFVPIAMLRAELGGVGGIVQGMLELMLGALLLGAIWDGMVLGHWYLVERRLSNRYMVWMAWVNVAAIVAGIGAVALSARSPVPCQGLAGGALEVCVFTFSPLLTIGNLTLWLGFGVIALLAVIAAFNLRLAREGGRSIQASTGMFYLAVILAPAAEFAAKVRFF